MSYERLLVENLPLVEQVVRTIARRHHLSHEEVDDLLSEVRLKLIENECDVLRRFERRSSLRTYLTVVVQRHFLDRRIAEWGKWRPCRQAQRAGPVGILLDRLMTRDGLTFDQALEILRTNHGVKTSDAELRALWQSMPDRTGRRFVGEETLASVPADGATPEQQIEGTLPPARVSRIEQALETGLSSLSAEDCLLLKMHFCDGRPWSQIARVLNLPQKRLYPRFERMLEALRAAFRASGLESDQVLALVGHANVELAPLILRAVARKFGGSPSP